MLREAVAEVGGVVGAFTPFIPAQYPDLSSMNIFKLGSGSAFTLDICNGERNTCRIIVEQVHEAAEAFCKDNYDKIRVLEVGYWNHLRNVWFGVMKKSLSALLGNTLREVLDDIYSRMSFLTSIKSVLHAVHKYFSMCDNYPKGSVGIFREWIET